MSLYVPAAFRAPDVAAVAAVLRDYPFATLITPDEEGQPSISHLPLLWDAEPGPYGQIVGHLAAANAHARRLTSAESIAIFHGPHCYVTPSWYREPSKMVPTWNYAAVHVHGRAELLGDDGKIDCIDRLTEQFERGMPRPWARGIDGDELRAKLKGIVAFRIAISHVEAKFKMNQNRDGADRAGVIAGLRGHGGSDELRVADWMQAHESQ